MADPDPAQITSSLSTVVEMTLPLRPYVPDLASIHESQAPSPSTSPIHDRSSSDWEAGFENALTMIFHPSTNDFPSDFEPEEMFHHFCAAFPPLLANAFTVQCWILQWFDSTSIFDTDIGLPHFLKNIFMVGRTLHTVPAYAGMLALFRICNCADEEGRAFYADEIIVELAQCAWFARLRWEVREARREKKREQERQVLRQKAEENRKLAWPHDEEVVREVREGLKKGTIWEGGSMDDDMQDAGKGIKSKSKMEADGKQGKKEKAGIDEGPSSPLWKMKTRLVEKAGPSNIVGSAVGLFKRKASGEAQTEGNEGGEDAGGEDVVGKNTSGQDAAGEDANRD